MRFRRGPTRTCRMRNRIRASATCSCIRIRATPVQLAANGDGASIPQRSELHASWTFARNIDDYQSLLGATQPTPSRRPDTIAARPHWSGGIFSASTASTASAGARKKWGSKPVETRQRRAWADGRFPPSTSSTPGSPWCSPCRAPRSANGYQHAAHSARRSASGLIRAWVAGSSELRRRDRRLPHHGGGSAVRAGDSEATVVCNAGIGIVSGRRCTRWMRR